MLARVQSPRVAGSAQRSRATAASIARPSRASLRCRAEQQQAPQPQQPAEGAKPAAEAPSTSPAAPEANAPLLQKGQGTAIVTGAISAILGIGYLVLVWMLDQRGGQMLPPPPEAFGP